VYLTLIIADIVDRNVGSILRILSAVAGKYQLQATEGILSYPALNLLPQLCSFSDEIIKWSNTFVSPKLRDVVKRYQFTYLSLSLSLINTQ
jgi:hypothetical protein